MRAGSQLGAWSAPSGPRGSGITSESPRETVGTLDQCQEGKGRVDWEAEREPGQGIAAERQKQTLLKLQSPRASEPHTTGVSIPVLPGEQQAVGNHPPSLTSLCKLSFLLLCHCEQDTAATPSHQESATGGAEREEW